MAVEWLGPRNAAKVCGVDGGKAHDLYGGGKVLCDQAVAELSAGYLALQQFCDLLALEVLLPQCLGFFDPKKYCSQFPRASGTFEEKGDWLVEAKRLGVWAKVCLARSEAAGGGIKVVRGENSETISLSQVGKPNQKVFDVPVQRAQTLRALVRKVTGCDPSPRVYFKILSCFGYGDGNFGKADDPDFEGLDGEGGVYIGWGVEGLSWSS